MGISPRYGDATMVLQLRTLKGVSALKPLAWVQGTFAVQGWYTAFRRARLR